MNGDINNLVIPVIIVVVGDVLLLITIIEYICVAECGGPVSAASVVAWCVGAWCVGAWCQPNTIRAGVMWGMDGDTTDNY